ELIVDNNGDHTRRERTGNVTFSRPGCYPIAIAMYESGAGEHMEAKFAFGGGLSYNELNLLGGTSDQPFFRDGVESTGFPSATDLCDPDLEITYSQICTGTWPWVLRRTFTVQDDCGNSTQHTQTILIDDTTDPVIDCPPDLVLECGSPTTPNATGHPAVSDNCDTNITAVPTDRIVPGHCEDEYTIVRRWKAYDQCSNSTYCIQVISVFDTTPPFFLYFPPDDTRRCHEMTGPAATGGPATAGDAWDPNPVVDHYDNIMAGPCPDAWTIIRTWRARDRCGNMTLQDQIIDVIDDVPPNLVIPAHTQVECGTPTDPSITGRAVANDNCDPLVNVVYNDASVPGVCPVIETIHRSWTATDNCNNRVTMVQRIDIEDNTPPLIVCPADAAVACGTVPDPIITGSAVALDVCDPNPVILDRDMTIGRPCPDEQVIERTWTATDFCNNQARCVQTIRIVDNIAPLIICPLDITVECTELTAPARTGTAVANDNCDADVTVVPADTEVPGHCPQERFILRRWTATDNCRNEDDCIQVITVLDRVAPSIFCPSDITVSDAGPTGSVVNFTVTALDACDNNPIVECTPPSGSLFPLGTTLVDCVAFDACWNITNCSFRIIVTPGEVDLAVTKTGHPDPVNSGRILTYTINIANQGVRAATNLVVTDTLPPYVNFLGSAPGAPVCTESNHVVTCTFPGLSPGASTTLLLNVEVNLPTGVVSTILTNVVTLESDDIERVPGDNVFTNLIPAYGLVELRLLDDPRGYGSITGATSGFYLVDSVFDLSLVPLHPKYGFNYWEIDGNHAGSDVPLNLRLRTDTTVQVFYTELFIDVTGDVTADLTNWWIDFNTGIMYSDILLCNVATTDVRMIEPFWFAYPSNRNDTFLLDPDGETNGLPYIDITEQVNYALPHVGNNDLGLNTNECVLVTHVAWFQVQAVPFSGTVYAVYADPPGDTGNRLPRDTDRDGIWNEWELAHGFNANHPMDAEQDPDADGTTNFEEFSADTNPHDPWSNLRIISMDGFTRPRIRWRGGRAVAQYLEWAESLEGPWIPIYTNPPPTALEPFFLHLTGPDRGGYYRIRVNRRIR
ncbi:MAG: HYR domain-containing protein, partial [Verrucomicrobiota bacterium]